MNWNLTRRAYMTDFVTTPLFSIAALAWAARLQRPHLSWLLWVACGWMSWTAIEYAMHRIGFHFFYKFDHARHHAFPQKWIGVPPWLSAAALAVVWGILAWAAGISAIGSILFSGFSIGYLCYIGIHYLIHHSETRYVDHLRRHHESHHRNGRINFGVSTRLWDALFGTLVRPA